MHQCQGDSLSLYRLHSLLRPGVDGSDLRKADGGDLCEVDGGELATACSHTPQLPPSFSKTFHAAKTFFVLAASQLKAEKLKPFQEGDQFLMYCIIVT